MREASAVPAVPTLEELLDAEDIGWESIKQAYANGSRQAEPLVHRLHFRRRRRISVRQRERILRFLLTGYFFTRDVRYFNEFLWFRERDGRDDALFSLAKSVFFSNLDSDAHHVHSLCSRQDARQHVENVVSCVRQARDEAGDGIHRRVGLLGRPTVFKAVVDGLHGKGLQPVCVSLRYHPNPILRLVLSNDLLLNAFCAAGGVRFRYVSLKDSVQSDKLTESLCEFGFDVGFHKLGMIIRRNVIDAFGLGLINDHWAVLPFVRGRSTLEYSLLFGFPIVATTHIVEETVDTGDILSVHDYTEHIGSCSSTKAVRAIVRRDMPARAVAAIGLLSARGSALLPNETNRGLTYYSMHPMLIRFVEGKLRRGVTGRL
ncbi:hypothetical protein ACFLQU_04085 [Verrucomicrobiota bacterium]